MIFDRARARARVGNRARCCGVGSRDLSRAPSLFLKRETSPDPTRWYFAIPSDLSCLHRARGGKSIFLLPLLRSCLPRFVRLASVHSRLLSLDSRTRVRACLAAEKSRVSGGKIRIPRFFPTPSQEGNLVLYIAESV